MRRCASRPPRRSAPPTEPQSEPQPQLEAGPQVPTLPQALKHPFVDGGADGPGTRRARDASGVFDTEIIGKMRAFAEAPALRRLVMLIEAPNKG